MITPVILAGGLGTRLRAAVRGRSKVMAEVNARPFVCYVLEQLEALGAERAVLCTGHHAEQLETHLGKRFHEIELSYSRELCPLGTAGALAAALPQIASSLVLVLNGDSYCTGDLVSFIAWHERHGAGGSLMLAHAEDARAYGSVDTDETGRIVSFREKCSRSTGGWVNAGVYLFRRDLLKTIPGDRAVSLETEMFPAWQKTGLFGYQSGGKLLDIGTPERYAGAASFFGHAVAAGSGGHAA